MYVYYNEENLDVVAISEKSDKKILIDNKKIKIQKLPSNFKGIIYQTVELKKENNKIKIILHDIVNKIEEDNKEKGE